VLPKSVLVKPPDEALEFPIVLHVTQDGEIILGGEGFTTDTLRIGLNRELAVINSEGKKPADANVIIRAHRNTAAGDVQEVIRVAQEQKLEKFALRVKEDRT
jgi:biopolymer transport protein ExbD